MLDPGPQKIQYMAFARLTSGWSGVVEWSDSVVGGVDALMV
jgi:hypothetical protein